MPSVWHDLEASILWTERGDLQHVSRRLQLHMTAGTTHVHRLTTACVCTLDSCQCTCTCRELVPIDRLSCVRTFTRLFDALATPENGVALDDGPDAFEHMVEMFFLFSLIWGLGGSLDEEGRKKFDGFMR